MDSKSSSMDIQHKLDKIYTIDDNLGTPSIPSIVSSTVNLSSIQSTPSSVGGISRTASHVTLESQV